MDIVSLLVGIGAGITIAGIVFVQAYIHIYRDITRERDRLHDLREQMQLRSMVE